MTVGWHVLLIWLFVWPSWPSGLDEKSPASNCVSYQVDIVLFGVIEQSVRGQNCEVLVQRVGSKVRIELDPKKFSSGRSIVDDKVAEILGGEDNLPIIVVAELPAGKQLQSETIPSTCNIRNKSAEIEFATTPLDQILNIEGTTSFTSIQMAVPSVGPGGMVAYAKDRIVLKGRFSAPFLEKLNLGL